MTASQQSRAVRDRFALSGATLLALGGLLLFIERGGVLAAVAGIAGVLLALKVAGRPARYDGGLVVGIVLAWSIAWGATWWHVRSTWESGETVELSVDVGGVTHVARTWVLDLDARNVLYYDAEPDVAAALRQAASIRIRRGDVSRTVTPRVTPVDEVPADRLAQVFAAMTDKYGDRNAATDVYYRFLGRSRDRIAVLIDYPR